MTAAAADMTRNTESPASRDVSAFKIGNGKILYAGALIALATARHATAGLPGYATPFAGAKGEFAIGRKYGSYVTGDTSASPIPEGEIELNGRVENNVAVSNLAGDITDVTKIVYATDDKTYDVTRPTRGQPVGMVIGSVSSTRAAVYFFSMGEMIAMGLAGNGRYLWHVGSFNAARTSSGNLRTSIVMPHGGRFIDVHAQIDVAPTGASGTGTCNLELDGTDVTGGVVTVATGDAIGDKKAGTAITAANEFAEGALLDVEFVVGTQMTAGRFDLFVTVAPTIGL